MVVHVPAIESMTKNNVESHLEILNKLRPNCDVSFIRPNTDVANWMSDAEWYKESSQKNLQCAVQAVMDDVKRWSDPDQYPHMLLQSIIEYLPPQTVINWDAVNNVWGSVEGAAVICGYTSSPGLTPTISPFCLMKLERGETKIDEALLHEIVVGLVLNEMRSFLPCFMFVYGGFYCSIPEDNQLETNNFSSMCASGEIDDMHACLLAEAIKTTSGKRNLGQFLRQPNSVVSQDEKSKVFVMLMFALAEANKRYGFIHGDLHEENVLIRALPNPTTFNFLFENTNIEITVSHVPIVIDYGRSFLTYKKMKLRPILYNGNNDSAKEFGDLDYFCYGEREANGENCLPENLVAKGRNINGYDIFRLGKRLNDTGIINNLGADIVNAINACINPGSIATIPPTSTVWPGSAKGNNTNAEKFASNTYLNSIEPGCPHGLLGKFVTNPNIRRLFRIIP